MKNQARSKRELLSEIETLRGRLAETEELARAISAGEVDALVVSAPQGERIYTLQGADRTYRVFVDSINEGAVTIASDLTIMYCNKCFSRIVEEPLAQIPGTSFLRFLAPAARETFAAILRQSGKLPSKGELRLLTAHKKAVPVSLAVDRLQLDKEKQFFCIIASDLTEHKRSEKILAEGRLIKSVLERAADAIVVCDHRGTIVRANEAARKFSGSIPLLQPFDAAFPLKKMNGRPFTLAAIAKRGNSQGSEARLSRADGSRYSVELSVGAWRGEGEQFYTIIIHDISARIKSELKIKEMVSERGLLLREVHHRTKNNMEVISGMISMLANSLQDKEACQALGTIRNRIRVMSLVHEKLHQADDLARVDMADYINDLTQMILAGSKANNAAIKLKLDIPNLHLPIDIAIPCGMIINELLTNSLKYAFPGKRQGEIGISLRRAARGPITFEFYDTGVGLPDDFDFLKVKSLGLKMVRRLVTQQLQGTFAVGRDHGFHLLMKFKVR